ncbi:MAG: hypothetical protein KF865_08505 [Bdellovibrionaceae bacterium]|nr:hypothetical protein [Pseudobdellovibrionaceae bacterium]
MQPKTISLSTILTLLATTTAHASSEIKTIESLLIKTQESLFLSDAQTEILANRVLLLLRRHGLDDDKVSYGKKNDSNDQKSGNEMDLRDFDNLAVRVYLEAIQLQPNREVRAKE